MIYRLLGELEIGEDGRLLHLPGGPTLIMLAALLVNANRRMSKTELIRAAWGSDDVEEAQLYKRVKAVRDLLAEMGRATTSRPIARFGYELRVAEEDVDALMFQRLVREADEAGAEQRTEDEIGSSAAGAAAVAGPASAVQRAQRCVPPGDRRAGAAAQAGRGAAVRPGAGPRPARARPGRADADRRLLPGRPAAVRAAHARRSTGAGTWPTWPARTSATGRRSPRRPAPSRTPCCATCTSRSPAGRAAIAGGESAIGGRRRSPSGPGRRLARRLAVPRQLPPRRRPRRPGRPGGRGVVAAPPRTRPAAPVRGDLRARRHRARRRWRCAPRTQSSDRYPDGQLYLELRGTSARGGTRIDTGEVLAQFLRALGVPHVPETKAERLASYRTLLAGRRVLIVLDDAADGAQVGELVPASAGCAVLVTARQRLPEISRRPPRGAAGAAGPRRRDRAVPARGARAPASAWQDDLDAVDQVVALCGGLPLALRIAGALRVHDHPRPTAELASRLARQGPAAFAYGELNVARTIGAGFERLDDGARQLFLGLGLLPLPGFGLWTAAALLAPAVTATRTPRGGRCRSWPRAS